MNTKKIFYHPDPKSIVSLEELQIPITKSNTDLKQTPINSCPAWNHQSSKIFTVHASSNLHLQIDEENDRVYSNNLNQKEFDECIILAQNWNSGNFSIIQITDLFSNFYWTNHKNVWISVLPHPLTSLNNNFYHCGAWFNLSNWPRMVNIGAVVIDKNKPITIKRGDPLYNIKFHTDNQNDNFDIVYTKLDVDKLEKSSKKVFFILNKSRSEGFEYQDILFESGKKSKCPFRFFWNK